MTIMYATPARLHAAISSPCTVVHETRSLLEGRLQHYRARIDSWQPDGVLATIDEIPFTFSAAAWTPHRTIRPGCRTYGVARVLVPLHPGFHLRGTPHSLLRLRTWLASLGLGRQLDHGSRALHRGYVVTGNLGPELARTLLTEDAVCALLGLQSTMIELSLSDGILNIAWETCSFDEAAVIPADVVDALSAMSRASRE